MEKDKISDKTSQSDSRGTTTLYNKEFLCIKHTVEHNYNSPCSTVGLQLHVSALYIDHLQVVI